MRRVAIVGGIGAALVILLAATNPSKSEYVDWLKGQVRAQASGNVVTLGLTALLGDAVFDSVTVRQDFLLFSVFRTSIGGNSMTTLGILHNFIPVKSTPSGPSHVPANATSYPGDSNPAVDQMGTATVQAPVKVLESRYGILQESPDAEGRNLHYPSSVQVSVPSRWANQVADYGIFNLLILGPAGWTETPDSLEGADGSIGVTLVPDNFGNPVVPAGQIVLQTTGGCEGCTWSDAAEYIPWVRDHWYDYQGGIYEPVPDMPKGLVLHSVGKDKVFYSLNDGNLVRKGLFVAGVAYSDLPDSPDEVKHHTFVRLEVALPPEDKDLALSIVRDYADRELNKMSRN